jgi:hypothetical protein
MIQKGWEDHRVAIICVEGARLVGIADKWDFFAHEWQNELWDRFDVLNIISSQVLTG